MPSYLIFRIYGPMCSWGEIAVGESRHTADRPSRSALLGLFGAALGIERSDEENQQALFRSWRFGLKVCGTGTLLRDYHTVMAPRKERKTVHRTRRQELLAPVVNTLLSAREYRMDSLCIVAAEPTSESRWTLDAMRDALLQPRFTLYLGRKSCPLALPLAPQVTEVSGLREALDIEQPPLAELTRASSSRGRKGSHAAEAQTTPGWPSSKDRRLLPLLRLPRYYWETGMVPPADTTTGGPMAPSVEFIRHDQPLSRGRWQFASRREWGHFSQEPRT